MRGGVTQAGGRDAGRRGWSFPFPLRLVIQLRAVRDSGRWPQGQIPDPCDPREPRSRRTAPFPGSCLE